MGSYLGEPRSPAHPSYKKGRLLIVEDEPEILLMLRTIAEAENFVVYSALNGALALEIFNDTPIDIIISDIMMPDMKGTDFLTLLRESGRATPVVFITAYATKEVALQVLHLGASALLEKPFSFDDFRKLINDINLVSRPAFSPQERKDERASSSAPKEVEALSAEIAVARVGAFRRASEQFTLGERQKFGKLEQMTKELCDEATPLVSAGEKSLAWLEERFLPHDLSYLRDTMGLVKDAALALGLQPMFSLSGLLEDCFRALFDLCKVPKREWIQQLKAGYALLSSQLQAGRSASHLSEMEYPEIYDNLRALRRTLDITFHRSEAGKKLGKQVPQGFVTSSPPYPF